MGLSMADEMLFPGKRSVTAIGIAPVSILAGILAWVVHPEDTKPLLPRDKFREMLLTSRDNPLSSRS